MTSPIIDNNRTNNTNYSNNFSSTNENNTISTPPDNNSLNNNINSNSIIQNNIINDNDRFAAIFENTANENYENTQKDTSNFLINSEAEHTSMMNGNSNHQNNTTSNNRNFNSKHNNKKKDLFPKNWNEMLEDEEHERV